MSRFSLKSTIPNKGIYATELNTTEALSVSNSVNFPKIKMLKSVYFTFLVKSSLTSETPYSDKKSSFAKSYSDCKSVLISKKSSNISFALFIALTKLSLYSSN